MPRLPEIQRDWGITVVRVMMGIIIVIAGYQKFAGGVGAVATGFEKIPIPLPWLAAPFISTLELVGGAFLIVGLGVRWLGLAFALELVVEGQSAEKGYRIGILGNVPVTNPEGARLWGAFIQGLRELGYVEGRNITIEHRSSEGQYGRLPDLAADLVRLNVDVIVAPAA